MVDKIMKLTEPCKICESTRWCGRPCIHSPKAGENDAAQPPVEVVGQKPVSQLLHLAEARIIILENELEQARTEIGSMRASSGGPAECPVCVARRERQKSIMAEKRAAQKAAKE